MDSVQPENSKTKEVTAENKELSFKLDEPVTALNISSLTNSSANDENSVSFVVIGKDSMEAQASLLSSFVDIQQKSMSIDYDAIVSSLNMPEMQQRLTEVLQENAKLKETLRQNNESMKQQFITLAVWQEEVTKVHQNHKQKFAETKELVNHLKKENAELKTKLCLSQHTEDVGQEVFSAIAESDFINASISQAELEQNMPQLIHTISKMAIEKWKAYITSISETFVDKELQFKLKEEQPKETKELESVVTALNCKLDDSCVETAKSLKCSEVCSAKDQEIVSLKESIALLEQKLQCVLTPVKSHDLPETSSHLSRQKFVQNIKQYNDMLQELTECFVEQIGRFAAIEKYLKEITDLLRLDDDNSKMQCKEKLCQCAKQLANEQIKIITDRQTLIKSQNQFQKIFSDYNSILYELEITIDENAKLNVLNDNSAQEKLQTSEQLEQVKRDMQSLEEEKKFFDRDKENLENEKKSLEIQKRNVDMERASLRDERKFLEQEKISLNEEKISLDHQSQLYENCERDLHNEKKILQASNEQLLTEANSWRQQVVEKNVEFQKIMEQLEQSTEEIQLLRSQLSLYEEDFHQEKKLKEALLEEKCKLTTELQKQIELNQKLQGLPSTRVKQEETSERATDPSLTICPKCDMPLVGLLNFMNHIEKCLNSK